jgi:hypothetical protein
MRSMTDEGACGLDLNRFDSRNRPLIRAPPAPTFSHEGRRILWWGLALIHRLGALSTGVGGTGGSALV